MKLLVLFMSIFAAAMSGKPETMKVDIVDNQIDVVSGVVYSQITGMRSSRPLHMTLLVPRTGEPKPAVLYFPGGGFTTCHYDKYIEMRMALAKAGFVVAAVEYRTIPDRFPALLVDAKSAVRFIRANAERFGVDPERIGVLGDSAGGYLAQMTGVTGGTTEFDKGDFTGVSSEVQAVVSIYGISDLRNIGEGFSDEIVRVHNSPAANEALLAFGTAYKDFPGCSVQDNQEGALKASPVNYVGKDTPPFLLMHGTADNHVSPVQSQTMYGRLLECGVQAECVMVEGAGHGDLYWFQKPVIDRVVEWFVRVLGR